MEPVRCGRHDLLPQVVGRVLSEIARFTFSGATSLMREASPAVEIVMRRAEMPSPR